MATWAGIAALLYMLLDDELPNSPPCPPRPPPIACGRPPLIPKLLLEFIDPEKGVTTAKLLAFEWLYPAPPTAPKDAVVVEENCA